MFLPTKLFYIIFRKKAIGKISNDTTDIGGIIGIADAMISGIVIGIVGLLMTIINYPL